MDKCNDEDEIISLSSGSSSTDEDDKDASAFDFPEADVEVETLFSDIKVCKYIEWNDIIHNCKIFGVLPTDFTQIFNHTSKCKYYRRTPLPKYALHSITVGVNIIIFET